MLCSLSNNDIADDIGADFHRAMVATAQEEKLLIGRRPVRNWTSRTISSLFLCRKLHLFLGQEPQLSPRPRDASCQLKSCQLPRNSAETNYTTSPDQIDGIKLEV